MTEAVLADAQFGVSRIVKPYLNFETDYQGVSGEKPIAIPGDLDPEAGKDGFDPKLLAGIPVPFGSKIVLWLPTLRKLGAQGGIIPYRYQVIFRVRNIRDFRENRSAYHFPRQSVGEDSQFVVPACQKTVLYEGTQPLTVGSGATADANHQLVGENYSPTSEVGGAPFVPGGASDAAYQQGLGDNENITYSEMQMDCIGDEMIILVTAPSDAAWDFESGGRDDGFSKFFGTADGTRNPIRDLGVYIFSGSNP